MKKRSTVGLTGLSGMGGNYVSSSFSPTQIGGMLLWLKADAGTYQNSGLTTPATANDDPVGGWADQSGLGNNVVQAGATARPLLKTNDLNSLPGIRFDGVNDSLTNATLGTLGYTGSTLSAFLVGKSVADSPGGGKISLVNGSQQNDFDNAASVIVAYEFVSSGNFLLTYRNSVGLGSHAMPDAPTPYIYGTTFDGAKQRSYFNGTQQNTSNSTGSFANDNVFLGSRFIGGFTSAFSNDDYFEILMYQGCLGPADIASLTTYLNAKWGVF